MAETSGGSTLARSTSLFASYGWWRATGSRRAGGRLIDALAAPDEHLKMLAATLLGRAGRRAEPLLVAALRQRRALPTVIILLGDLEDPRLRPEIEPFAADADPEVARAARDALPS